VCCCVLKPIFSKDNSNFQYFYAAPQKSSTSRSDLMENRIIEKKKMVIKTKITVILPVNV